MPGAVAGWVALCERFGKLPFADLLEPAIEIAERGYLVPIIVQQKWVGGHAASSARCRASPRRSCRGAGAPEVGELFPFPAAARALRAIAATQGRARSTAARSRRRSTAIRAANGGGITASDFAAYQPEWVEPIGSDYRGYTLHEIPPNGQGIAALIALGILRQFDIERCRSTAPSRSTCRSRR